MVTLFCLAQRAASVILIEQHVDPGGGSTGGGPPAAERSRLKIDERRASVVCRVGARLCALPLDQVVETMRPMAVEPVPGAPAFVIGVAIIRGAPVPVVDAGALLGGEAARGRLITVRIGSRHVALAVDEVLGVRRLAAAALTALPPLLRDARQDGVASLGALDDGLLLVLEGARLVPDSLWAALQTAGDGAGEPS
jgi:purine-binding chemotaxis protein CheW